MKKDLYINGENVDGLLDQNCIGEGHESEVYGICCGEVLVLFKNPDHPDYAGNAQDEQDARCRLEQMQSKLRSFPTDLSEHITAPEALVTDKTGTKLLGYRTRYLMGDPLGSYTSKSFRKEKNISNNTVMEMFADLHRTVSDLHKQQVVIGDFQPDNIIVERKWRLGQDGYQYQPYIIDTHSFQFGDYLCGTFKPEFGDPLLCDYNARDMQMIHPHTTDSDWYAYTAMLMQSLIRTHPYGGVHQTRDPQKRVAKELRPLHRITVFHPDVRYDVDAVPYSVLPEELREYFQAVLEHDLRREFPLELLEVRWKMCNECGTEYARLQCPVC